MKPLSFLLPPLAAAALAAASPAAFAIGVTDATGDYVPGFAGSKAGDLDVAGAFVTYNVATDTFVFEGTMNADIPTASKDLYVWGVDRGQGTARFAANGIDGVLFDSVVVFNADGSGSVNQIVGGASFTLPAGTAKVIGSTIIGEISGSMLPSLGFDKTAYTWNLWPRDGTLASGFTQISDFAPDNSNSPVTVIGAVPEPGTWAMLGVGLGLVGVFRRRRIADR
ncbi:MAG: PEP-CTERM sorting domain-containing protein [Proteobacteria bacterium]|nr:PEP-CTERM sorting domain-containing protein [Pseudomonadota bacterium]